MYRGSYYAEDEKLMPPANYDGTALLQEEVYDKEEDGSLEASCPKDASRGGSAPLNIPLLSGLFSGEGGIRLPKIGTEEILILAAAAFLLFSKSGDKECAIFLLILLFIN